MRLLRWTILATMWPLAAAAQNIAVAVPNGPVPACAKDALKAIAATHTIPPYPTISQRTGEEGTVSIRLTIAADGTVSAATLEKSSGSIRLDDAAIQYIQENWRWQPFDKNCAPAIQTMVNFVWSLKNAPQGQVPLVVVDLDPADYPPDARARAEQGYSTVAVQMSETGAVVNTVLARTSNFPDLDAKAVEIARTRWQWMPAQMAGKPVATTVFVVMHWRLDAAVGTPASPPRP